MSVKSEEKMSVQRQKFQLIYQTLRSRISLLEYAPGQRLSEEALAEEFGVSRTPLRKVLTKLETEGLLRSIQSVGTLVTDVDVDELAHTYELRMELAVLIGKLAPTAITPELIERFEGFLKRLEAMLKDPVPLEFAKVNIDILHALLQVTENEPLKEIIERLYYKTARIWLKSIPDIDYIEEIRLITREVEDILAAIKIGDLDAVGHIWRTHISSSYMRMRHYEQKNK